MIYMAFGKPRGKSKYVKRRGRYSRYRGRSKRSVIHPFAGMQVVNANPKLSNYSGWPSQLLMKHKYSTRFTVNAISTNNIFRLNSLYDPDYTGAGLKSTNFDETFAIYALASVYAAKVDITYVPNASSLPSLIQLAYTGNSGTIDDDPLLSTTTNDVHRKYVSGNTDICRLSMYVDLRKRIGPQVLSDIAYSHTISTSPTQSQFFVVDALSLDGTNAITGSLVVDITYYALHYQLYPSKNQELD